MPPDNRSNDDLDRDVFYTPDDEDDELEYELEPPDEELLVREREHAERMVADTESRIDVDELFRGQERRDHDDLLKELFPGGKVRFGTRHLLWATALLAVFLAIGRVTGFGLPLFLFFIVGVSGGLIYLNRREQAREAELERKKREFRESLRRKSQDTSSTTPAPAHTEVEWREPKMKQLSSPFTFSTREMMIAFTVAAVIMGLISWIGPANGALLLGFFALVGLVIHMAGFDPPPVIALGWWLLLMMYVVVSLCAVFWQSAVAGS
jgi:hypothetical protein